MARVSDQEKADRQNRIVEAAARKFAEKGFSGASVSDIAQSAGVGKGTVYSYFESKEDLFFGVFEWYTQTLALNLSVGIDALGGSASQRLLEIDRALMASWSNTSDLFSLSLEFWAASAASAMRDRFRASMQAAYAGFRELVAAIIKEGIAAGEFRSSLDTEALSAAIVGTWDAMLLQAWFDPDFDPTATSRHFLEVLIAGFKSLPDTPHGVLSAT